MFNISRKVYGEDLKNIGWYFNRLSKMSMKEVGYRFENKIKTVADKRIKFGYSTPRAITEGFSFDSLYLLCNEDSKEGLQNFSDIVTEFANNYLENRLSIFGVDYDFGENIDWHLDVNTGNRWPIRFWGDINTHTCQDVGAPKFVWEQNRLYQLPILGLAYCLTKKEKYAKKICKLIANWMDANPYPFGVNWTSGIELAIRAANLIFGLSFLKRYTFLAEEKDLFAKFFWLHGCHLYRYPSKYSSNNNHAIAEAFGLFLIGTLLDNFRESSMWAGFGKQVLERECKRQILFDGGSYEYSTTYLSFVVDFFLIFKIVCDLLQINYDPVVDKRLEAACDYIHTLMDKGGNIPNIGDQDSAILVNFGLDNSENFKSILNTGSVLFFRPEFIQDNFPDLKTLLLLNDKIEKSKNIQNRINTSPALDTSLLKKSGLALVRGSMTDKELLFIGNATPLGMPPLYAHGHLDALSFTLSFDGKQIFIDPGTYVYHCGGNWRTYFRSTAAHNTIRINQQDLTDMPGDFMFGQPYKITEHTLHRKDSETAVWRAGHNAYNQKDEPVHLTRQAVIKPSGGSVVFEDFIESSDSCQASLFFHLHPACHVWQDGYSVMVKNSDMVLRMSFEPHCSVHLYKGSTDPIMGWFSSRFNHLESSWSVCADTSVAGSAIVRTQITIL